jgi:S-formylglutathione hydrolase FrmB
MHQGRYRPDVAHADGYDHSYYFISTFMADHLRGHATRLLA